MIKSNHRTAEDRVTASLAVWHKTQKRVTKLQEGGGSGDEPDDHTGGLISFGRAATMGRLWTEPQTPTSSSSSLPDFQLHKATTVIFESIGGLYHEEE